jgi:beta-lactam-binding protein with PASTA domain/serine/threonine protein kinase
VDHTPDSPSPPETSLDELSGELINGRFRLGRLVSGGDVAATYEAREQTADPAAGGIFTLRLHSLWWVDEQAGAEEEFAGRCAEAMQTVMTMDHRNLAVVRDWGITVVAGHRIVFTAMDPIAGGSLGGVYDRGRRLSISQAVVIGVEVCRALDYIHRRGVIHTMVSPSSIMFDEYANVRLIDVGIGRLIAEQYVEAADKMPADVARYATPEHATETDFDPSTDVYSLGLTLLEGITGEMPFVADTIAASLAARVDRLLPVSADLGPLAAVLERAGRPTPSERFTPSQFGRAMLQLADRLPRPEPLKIGNGMVGGIGSAGDTGSAGASDPDATQALEILEPEILVSHTPGAEQEETEVIPEVSSEVDPVTSVLVTSDGGTEMLTQEQPRSDVISRNEILGRSARWGILAAVVVLAGLVTVIGARMLSEPTAIVPNLLGMQRGEAVELSSEEGWSVRVEIIRSDLEPRMGHVVSTVPPPGFRLALSEPLVLVISAGPAFRVLPEIEGALATEARRLLESLGLEVEEFEQFDEDLPIGGVLSWEVVDQPELRAGDQILPGATVAILVSQGPEPRRVPDVIGLSGEEAEAALLALRLVLVVLDEVFDPEIPAGAVAFQSPVAQSRVARGAVVEIAISKGPDLVAFPDLTGTDLREAQRLLAEVGLIGVLQFGASDGEFSSASLEGEEVRAGDLIPRGVQVDLTFL